MSRSSPKLTLFTQFAAVAKSLAHAHRLEILEQLAQGELEARLAELDGAQEIVAYCRGPYCVLSYEAVAALRTKGFKVRRLEDGFPEWRAAGLPVESSLSR